MAFGSARVPNPRNTGLRYAHRSRSVPADRWEDRTGAFLYKLKREDGTPADPPTLRTAFRVEPRRYDPAGPRQDSPGHRDPARDETR
jgi:hypothetical protein